MTRGQKSEIGPEPTMADEVAAAPPGTDEASGEVPRDDEGLPERAERLASDVADGARQIAAETDRLFLTALGGLAEGSRRASATIAAAGRAVPTGWIARAVPALRRRETRERVRELILREARRAGGDEWQEELVGFADQIGLLVELVVQGQADIPEVKLDLGEAEPSPEGPDVARPA